MQLYLAHILTQDAKGVCFFILISYYSVKLQDSMEFVISGMKIGGLEGIYLIRPIVFMDEMRYIVNVYYIFVFNAYNGQDGHDKKWRIL